MNEKMFCKVNALTIAAQRKINKAKQTKNKKKQKKTKKHERNEGNEFSQIQLMSVACSGYITQNRTS